MTRKYFGTDGIRGEVGTFPITPDFIMRLGYAAGRVFSKQNEAGSRTTVLIGKDTRVSGYMLEAALEAGFSAAGVDVVLCGPIPTPGVAYLTSTLRLNAGLVISASHNPYQDNGVKFFSALGDKLSDTIESEIEHALLEPFQVVGAESLGKARRLDDAPGRYIEFCKSTFPNHLDLHGMKLVVDTAHGAAYHIAGHVFHELGAEVIPLGNQPNGLNINDQVGATAPAACIALVKETGADFGIALDGDADRLQMVDRTGRLFNGDELLYVVAKDRLKAGKSVAGVVGTLMTNLAIEQGFEKLGIPFERALVGDRYVLEKLRSKNWALGGEGSGHLLFLDRHTTGDGIIAALQVLATVKRSKEDIGTQLQDISLFPQVLMNIAISKDYDWKKDLQLKDTITEVEHDLRSIGRVLIRPSGTEPVLRVMAEASTRNKAEWAAQKISQSVSSASKA